MNKKKSVSLMMLMLAIATIAVSSEVQATDETHTAVFDCYAIGRGLVIWNGYIGAPHLPGAYYENSLEGFIGCSGSAQVKEETEMVGWYGTDDLESIQTYGFLVSGWKHQGYKYRLMIEFFSDQTNGLFNPGTDQLVMPYPTRQGLPVPGIQPDEGFLSYRGLFTKVKGNRYSGRMISGEATLTVYLHLDVYRLVLIFELELEDETTIPVTLAWFDKDFLHFYGASIFYSNVDLEM